MNEDCEKADKDYKPHGIVGRMAIKPPPEKHARRSKRFDSEKIEVLTNRYIFRLNTFILCRIL